jgi:hypothetical protein
MLVLGTGTGASMPTAFKEHFQHVVLLGVGYRSNKEKWQWGFQVGSGPLWYMTNYVPEVFYENENRVLGYVEGNVRAGLKLFPGAYTGIYFGYASPWSFDAQRYPGNTYCGGVDFGVYVDWR